MSCKKDTITSEVNTTFYSGVTAKNGRLVFDSEESLKRFDTKFRSKTLEFDEAIYKGREEVLQELESMFDYRSLRKTFLRYDGEKENGLEDNWLKDDVRMAMLNEDYEIQIGNNVYIYFSANQVIVVPANETEKIALIRTLVKGDDDNIPKSIIDDTTVLISDKYHFTRGKFKTHQGISGNYVDCTLFVEHDYASNPCNSFEVRLETYFYEDITLDVGEIELSGNVSSVEIDWDDGTTETIHNNHSFSIVHEYDSEGTYIVEYTVTYFVSCTGEEEEETFTREIEVNEGSCYLYNMDTTGNVQVTNHKLEAELWVKKDFFGEHQVAKSTSWEWDEHWLWGNRWVKERAEVHVSIFWTFRNNECDVVIEGSLLEGVEFGGWEHDSCNNCKDKRAGKTNSGVGNLAFLDDEIRSFHSVENDGIYMEKELFLSYCD